MAAALVASPNPSTKPGQVHVPAPGLGEGGIEVGLQEHLQLLLILPIRDDRLVTPGGPAPSVSP